MQTKQKEIEQILTDDGKLMRWLVKQSLHPWNLLSGTLVLLACMFAIPGPRCIGLSLFIAAATYTPLRVYMAAIFKTTRYEFDEHDQVVVTAENVVETLTDWADSLRQERVAAATAAALFLAGAIGARIL